MKENYRRKQHSKKCKSKISAKGVLCPKTDSIIEKQNILTKSQSPKALYLSGYFYFVLREVKLLISRQSLFNTRYKSVLLFYYLFDFAINHLIRSPRATQDPIYPTTLTTVITESQNNCISIRFLLIPHTKLSRSFYLILLYIL